MKCRKKKKDKGKSTPSVSATIVDTSSNAIVASFYGMSESKAWMLDSGCTKHMTPHRNEFVTYQSISPMPILLGDFNQTINYVGVGITILMVYVDDITVMGNDAAHIILVKQELTKRFDLTDLGELTYFLGIRVTSVESWCFASIPFLISVP